MNHDFVEFVDEVGGADAVRALQVCADEREHIVLSMACRLGMRRGAIQKLRLASIVENLRPDNKAPWNVQGTISGWDKGPKWNEWDLRLAPGLRDRLMSCINETWRPKYEAWVDESKDHKKPGMRLLNGYLFPCLLWKAKDQCIDGGTINDIIRRVLNRAGIHGPNAHAHACRKGFSSDLLRANNPGNMVSKALHHKNEKTTFQHYDKRSRSEILANLRIPVHWTDANDPNNPTTDSHTGGAGSDSLTVAAAKALHDEMELNEAMHKKLEILMSILSPEQVTSFTERCRQEGVENTLTTVPPVMS